MSWAMIAGATVVASLALLMLAVRRGRPRKGLRWADNSPRKSSRILGR